MNSTITLPTRSPEQVRTQAMRAIWAAFKADPVARWMYPGMIDYAAHFPNFIEFMGGAAFDCETAAVTPQGTGAALWLPPGASLDEEGIFELVSTTVERARLPRLLEIFEQMGERHPAEPHWYLPMIGVDPRHQNRGHGSFLLRDTLRRCDREGVLAYLESSNPRNIPLYERHGFRRAGIIRVAGAPSLIPMVRDPQS